MSLHCFDYCIQIGTGVAVREEDLNVNTLYSRADTVLYHI